jgi:hypothetical protein
MVKLVLEFLHNRGLNISLLALERETGIINGCYSDDMLFLRQLILDGQWDDVIDFIQPLSSMDSFKLHEFEYLIYKHKFLELLCIKAEYGGGSGGGMTAGEFTVDEVVKCLNILEKLCPSKEDYSNLCLLLTLPHLSDHVDYIDWNPSNARVECFKDVYPLVEKYLAIDQKRDKLTADRLQSAKNDRLVQLLIKGILYESCVDFCQHKATSTEYDSKDLKLTQMLSGTGFSDADLSLLSWLQAIPHETFACPFEQKSLNVDVKNLEKPSLEASWSEQILVTPIKPRLFPHSAVPNTRPRSADMMSRSLNPQYDGLAHGLGHRALASTPEIQNILSRSFAGFHISANPKKSIMQMSVDKLFEDGHTLDTHSSIIIESSSPRNSPRIKDAAPKSPGLSGSFDHSKNTKLRYLIFCV